MTPQYWQRIKAVLNAVIDVPQKQQQALLEEICRNDPALRRDVEVFLNAGEPDLPERPLIDWFDFQDC
ncbi:MAG: hypothetical protein QNK37_29360 [Acidobacteriota bacterium]|nr:hypothetical protein [Acidobacteriota bacterium]